MRNSVAERFGTRAGAIFKPVTQERFTDWGSDWAADDQSYDPKTDLTEAQKQRVIALGRLVSGATDEEFAGTIGDSWSEFTERQHLAGARASSIGAACTGSCSRQPVDDVPIRSTWTRGDASRPC